MDRLEHLINQMGGIQPPHLAFYVESIRFNTEAAMHSIAFIADFIDMTNAQQGDYEMTRKLQTQILDHLQNILIHAASLSRYFWPSKEGMHKLHKKRAATLRQLFGIKDNSPLKNRRLRNQLEHFDENLDSYLWEKPLVGYVLPAYVGGEMEGNGVPVHLFRAYYIDTGVFETLGIRHEIQPIADEIGQIYSNLSKSNS